MLLIIRMIHLALFATKQRHKNDRHSDWPTQKEMRYDWLGYCSDNSAVRIILHETPLTLDDGRISIILIFGSIRKHLLRDGCNHIVILFLHMV